MFESAILNILVFIIVFVILIEYINDKMYQTKKPTELIKEIPDEKERKTIENKTDIVFTGHVFF